MKMRSSALCGCALLALVAHAETVGSPRLHLQLSSQGAITGARWAGVERAIAGHTQLAGCRDAGPAVVRQGVEFERTVECGERRAHVVDRFTPIPQGIRWEVRIRGEGAPWTTAIETHFRYPAAPGVSFWTAWADPSPVDRNWRDPLVTAPPANRKLYYGAPPVEPATQRKGVSLARTDLFSLPLATFSEAAHDAGLTLALALDDTMLDLTLETGADGAARFSRLYHRIGGQTTLSFHLDLVPHEAGWRGGVRYLAGRYPQYFDPPNAKAADLAGTSAYSGTEVEFDPVKMRAMAFRTNWMASFDFPYIGLFLPPVADDETWVRFPGDSRGEYKPEEAERNGRTSIPHMAAYARRMRSQGFHVLNYFNATEFGDHVSWPPAPRPPVSPEWRDCSSYLARHFRSALVLLPDGKPIYTWGRAVVVDPGDPTYQAHLLEQARRHLAKLPDADGLCIDRMDWLRLYNPNRDDGVSWFDGRPASSLVRSWAGFIGRLAPELHAAGKVLFCNNHTKRIDLLRGIDGIYDEFTYHPPSLNTTALLCVNRPVLGWTEGEANLRPDPDAYFQRHLHMGVYPMAPFPGNDHSIRPGEWVDRQYLDYGPLLDAMRGRKWVLTPHAVAVVKSTAKANLFRTPEGYVVPVTFGGKAAQAVVELRGVKASHAEVLHLASARWQPVKFGRRIAVPLVRGCAMLRLH